MTKGFKTSNEYAQMISPGLFEDTPKTVLAALAVSLLINAMGWDENNIDRAILEEWQTLYGQGIVPQKPPNTA